MHFNNLAGFRLNLCYSTLMYVNDLLYRRRSYLHLDNQLKYNHEKEAKHTFYTCYPGIIGHHYFPGILVSKCL